MTDDFVNFPIDLVYTWVNGNDPIWRAKKDKFLGKAGILHKDAKTNARFRDNDELKYSLRSVQNFAPWINHIFIITDGQTPSWLNTKHPKISIIDHKQIMPKNALPTFNSYAIESHLDNIPNLSEHFLYSNDDTMFGRNCIPEDFFNADGTPINVVKLRRPENIWTYKDLEKSNTAKIGLHGKNLAFTKKLVYDKTGKKYHCYPSHNIEPLRKSYFTGVKKIFSKEFQTTSYNKFRKYPEISWFIHILYNNAVGRNRLVLYKKYENMPEIYSAGDYRGFNKKCILRFIKKLFNKPQYLTLDGRRITDKIIKNNPYLFCINDTDMNDKRTLNKNKKFLNSYFTNKTEI